MNEYGALFTAILWVLGAFAAYKAGAHKTNNFEELKCGDCGLLFGDKGTEGLIAGIILVVWPFIALRSIFRKDQNQ